MSWAKLDDKWCINPKLRALPRSARGLFADLISWSSSGTDGWIPVTCLDIVGASTTDPDLKKLLGVRVLHKRGDECRCLTKRRWEWPRERGFVIHDFLAYNPAKDETEVRRAQTAELRNWPLREEIRARDLGCCRYCAEPTVYKDGRSPAGETVDHVDPKIADGANNLVLACRGCNGRKKNRTPEQAGMRLLGLDELAQIVAARNGATNDTSKTGPTTSSQTRRVGAGRDGSGRAPAVQTTTQVGPPTTPRDSVTPNPYLRVYASPDDPPDPEQPTGPARASPPPRPRPPKPKPTRKQRKRRR